MTELSSAPTVRRAERRHLTVLFCDLVASTAIARRLDPEDLGVVIGAYQRCCREVIERWGGRAVQCLGDGLLAFFGHPRAHEGDAERAVRAGLDLIQAIRRLQTPAGQPLAARIGIASGTVMVGSPNGEGAGVEDIVVGQALNLAARLQTAAAPNAVVVARCSRNLIAGRFDLKAVGTRVLKGFDTPVEVWRVLRPRATSSRFDARRTNGLTPLVGRAAELAALDAHWRRACRGQGQVVQLEGEPGIGKSRLLWTFRERIATAPHHRLALQCLPHRASTPFHPLIRLIEGCAGIRPDQARASRRRRLAAWLAAVGGQARLDRAAIGHLIGLTSGPPGTPTTPDEHRPEARIRAAMTDLLAALAAERPLLLELEDAQWIDPATAGLVNLASARLAQLPVLLIVAQRPEAAPRWTWPGKAARLGLDGLGPEDSAALVADLGGDRLTEAVRDQILARADGIPLFIEELTQAVRAGAAPVTDARRRPVEPGPPEIPPSLQELLTARLDHLDRARAVVQIAAVIGREFTFGRLCRLSGLSEVELTDAIARLVAGGLIEPCWSGAYRFKHALVHEAAERSLLRQQRGALRARLL